MDFTKVDLSELKDNNSIKMTGISRLDYAKLKVASALINKSLSSMMLTALLTYLARNWSQHEERLEVEAKAQGKTPEELFEELVNRPLGR